jgi:5-methylcytosine-specific restriction enzyme A
VTQYAAPIRVLIGALHARGYSVAASPAALQAGAVPIDLSISPIGMLVRVYLRRISWARRNDPDEYRIQQTLGTLTSPVGGMHLLLGFYNFAVPGIGQIPVFAGFDPIRHAAPSGRSNSLYVRMESLSAALEHGMWVDGHNIGDPVIAFRAENLPDYLLRMPYFHGLSAAGVAAENSTFSRRWPLLDDTARVANSGQYFNPSSLVDARERALAEIVRRRGQTAFRQSLLRAYGGRCAMTGCDAEEALEAAHIHPYLGAQTNRVENGLLLRADVHTLFDLGLVAVDSAAMTSVLAGSLMGTQYAVLAGRRLTLPATLADRPSAAALDWHRLRSQV